MSVTEDTAGREAAIALGQTAELRMDDDVAFDAADRPVWRRLPMRTGLALSAALHATVVLFAFLHMAKPFEALSANAILVDIVATDEAADSRKSEPSGPVAQPARFMSNAADSAAEAVPSIGWLPPAVRKSDPSSFSVSALANMLHVELTPGGESSASESKHAPDVVAAFKAHLQKCWVRPSASSDAKQLKVVIRVALDPAGHLTKEPALIEAPASPSGPAVVASAMRALRQCGPYNFLPSDRYEEWKRLDLRFSASGVS